MLYIAASSSFFFLILSLLSIPYGIAERGDLYKAHMDFIASCSVDVSVEGWIGPSLRLSLCDCVAYTNLLTVLVLKTSGDLKTSRYSRFLTEVLRSSHVFWDLALCGCWSVPYLLHVQVRSVTFEEEGVTFL
jgi:hypothetical protein